MCECGVCVCAHTDCHTQNVEWVALDIWGRGKTIKLLIFIWWASKSLYLCTFICKWTSLYLCDWLYYSLWCICMTLLEIANSILNSWSYFFWLISSSWFFPFMPQTFLTSSQENLKPGCNHGLAISITLKWYLKQKYGHGTNRKGDLLVRTRNNLSKQ